MSDSLPLPFSSDDDSGSGFPVMLVIIGVAIAAIVVYFLVFRKKHEPVPPPKPVTAAAAPMPPSKPASILPPDSIVPYSVAATDRATRPMAPSGIDAYSGKQPLWAEYVPGPGYDFQYNQPENRVKASVIEVTSLEAFENVLKNKPTVVCAFTMANCGHCKNLKPEYINAATKTTVPLLLFDEAQAGRELIDKLGIKGFPTIIKFKDGLPFAKFENMPRTADNLVAFANNNS